VTFARTSPLFDQRPSARRSIAGPETKPSTRVARAAELLLGAGLALGFGCSNAVDAVDAATGGDMDAFSQIYASDTFQKCGGCHAPGAPGKTDGTEATQDWSTRDKAYASLHQKASGLIGNFAGCNGVPFLGASAAQSLLMASLDADTRAAYQNPQFPDCNADAISDQTLKVGSVPASLLQELQTWIDSGAPDK
jgi:mono/diheme cytochrome c family protein